MIFTIKQARAMAGLTQVQMAEKLGISRDAYRKIEINPERVTVKQAIEISNITGIDMNQIFFASDSTLCRESDIKTKQQG